MTMETFRTINIIFSKQFSARIHKNKEIISGTKSNSHGIKTKEKINMEDTLSVLFW